MHCVPSNVPTITPSLQRTRGELNALVQNFDRDSTRNALLLQELLNQDRQAFYSVASEILSARTKSSGSQHLMSMLAGDESFLPALCDPSLTHAQALALARAAVDADVMLDVLLAKHLSKQAVLIGESICPPEMQRLMDILAAVSDGARVLPDLMILAQTPGDLQSKAVLMIRRINRARTRADAVEELWGLGTPETRRQLQCAARDPNNRVAGNALIALYRLGDCWTIPEVFKMADHKSFGFRATAAWIMGETGDPRFTKTLGRLVGEAQVAVRTRAFAALGLIRASASKSRQAGERRIAARFQQTPKKGWRALHLEVSTPGSKPIAILGTQLILAEDGQEIMNYSIDESPVSPYIVSFESVAPEARELRIIVKTPEGWGEDTISIPPQSATAA